MGKGREGWKGSERGRLELIEFLMSSLPLPPPLFDQEDEEEEEEQSLESEGARKREREREQQSAISWEAVDGATDFYELLVHLPSIYAAFRES